VNRLLRDAQQAPYGSPISPHIESAILNLAAASDGWSAEIQRIDINLEFDRRTVGKLCGGVQPD
jgi:hypothetical protein